MKIKSIAAFFLIHSFSWTLFSGPTLISSPAQHAACLNSTRPIIVLYTDPVRCAPCRLFEPTFNKVSNTTTDIDFYVVHTSTPGMQDVFKAMAIQSIPVTIFGFNKKAIMRSSGRSTETEFKKKIASFKEKIAELKTN